jgi:hypothetical protein
MYIVFFTFSFPVELVTLLHIITGLSDDFGRKRAFEKKKGQLGGYFSEKRGHFLKRF